MVSEEDITDLLEESEEELSDTTIAIEIADNKDDLTKVKRAVRDQLTSLLDKREVECTGLKYSL